MKVTAIMPTRDRRAFIPLAIASLLSQDWPPRRSESHALELIVVDDGEDAVGALIRELMSGSRVRYEYIRMAGTLTDQQRTIGAKRNLACDRATGDVIVHWDDDDWSAPGRIGEQLVMLAGSTASVTGYSSMLFWEEARQRTSRYENKGNYALGSSLCYSRSFWKAHRFPEQNVGEDNAFVNVANEAKALISVPGSGRMVARVHPGNTSKNKSNFAEIAREDIPAEFFTALELKAATCV